jgi:hypothetical protein
MNTIISNASFFVKTKVHYYKDILDAFKWMLQITLQQIPLPPPPTPKGYYT